MITLYPSILFLLSKIFKKKPYTDGLSSLGDGLLFIIIPVALLILYILTSAVFFGIFSATFLSTLSIAGYIFGAGVAADLLVYVGSRVYSLFEK